MRLAGVAPSPLRMGPLPGMGKGSCFPESDRLPACCCCCAIELPEHFPAQLSPQPCIAWPAILHAAGGTVLCSAGPEWRPERRPERQSRAATCSQH